MKFSKNWLKQKVRITKLHNTIANIRKDYAHKTTTSVSKNHAMIVIEDLQVRNMSGSLSGTIKSKGKNVGQKSGMNVEEDVNRALILPGVIALFDFDSA